MSTADIGTIFNVQHFSIHDGPGVRTTVFLKGCNLRCFWCHNPEAAVMKSEMQFFPEKCIACGACVETCPEGAQLLERITRIYDRDRCRLCFRCVEECFSGALERIGREYGADEVMAEILRDRLYYQNSGGGVTFSGGEPLLQKDFLRTLLLACRQEGIHCAVDTAGNLPWESLAEIAPLADLFLYDVKAFDEETHRRATGVSNQRILSNLKRLSETGSSLWVRIPVIPGVNDSVEEMAQITGLLAGLKGIQRVELLPFHTLGSEKYASLGLTYPAEGVKLPGKSKMETFQAALVSAGVVSRIMD